MKETLETLVMVNNDVDEERLEFRYEDNVIEMYLSGEHICSMDWPDNLSYLFKRAIELWGDENEK